MADKEAVMVLHTYMRYDSSKMTEQQALDKLEDILHELDEKHNISVNIHDRYIQEDPSL